MMDGGINLHQIHHRGDHHLIYSRFYLQLVHDHHHHHLPLDHLVLLQHKNDSVTWHALGVTTSQVNYLWAQDLHHTEWNYQYEINTK
jgi:hypothetical protein